MVLVLRFILQELAHVRLVNHTEQASEDILTEHISKFQDEALCRQRSIRIFILCIPERCINQHSIIQHRSKLLLFYHFNNLSQTLENIFDQVHRIFKIVNHRQLCKQMQLLNH